MKVTYTVPNGRLQFEFDATTPKDTFAQVASIQEVFEEPACGKCGSASIRFEVREFNGNQYFKLSCGCGAQLDYHQNKDMKNLYITREDRAKPGRGWYIYSAQPTTPTEAKDMAGLRAILAGNPDAARLNGLFPSLANFSPADKTAAWELIQVFATGKGIKFDEAAKRFKKNGANGS